MILVRDVFQAKYGKSGELAALFKEAGQKWPDAMQDGRALLTGDTLFLNAVGRPDLHASSEAVRARAHALYASIQRLLALPRETLVLPGHTSAPIPFDRQPIAATLGQVRAATALLRVSEAGFVEALLARIPPTPPNHTRIIALNEAGALADTPIELEAGANRCAIA